MNQTDNLRKAFQGLRQAFTCPVCGKSRLIMATGWRGHGTGRRGEASYDAVGFEQIDPNRHCTCPGGPAHGLRHEVGASE